MKMKIIYLIFFALMGLTGACESDAVNVKLPEYTPKLVIAAFISPSDTASYIYIGTSFPHYVDATNSKPLGNISAFISDGIHEVALDTSNYGPHQYLAQFKLIPSKMKIEYGKTYNLRVITTNGYSAEGTCTVPEKKSFEFKVDTLRDQGLKAKASFNDIAGEEDYYRVQTWVRFYRKSPGAESISSKFKLRLEKKFLSDEKIDGTNIVVYDDYLNFLLTGVDSAFFVINLLHTEKSYYLYHKSLDNYQGDDIPFVEPTLVFSNIRDGLGVFTSYTVDSAVFRLK